MNPSKPLLLFSGPTPCGLACSFMYRNICTCEYLLPETGWGQDWKQESSEKMCLSRALGCTSILSSIASHFKRGERRKADQLSPRTVSSTNSLRYQSRLAIWLRVVSSTPRFGSDVLKKLPQLKNRMAQEQVHYKM